MKTMLRLVAALAICTAPLAAQAQAWKEYSYPQDGFAVQFPAKVPSSTDLSTKLDRVSSRVDRLESRPDALPTALVALAAAIVLGGAGIGLGLSARRRGPEI